MADRLIEELAEAVGREWVRTRPTELAVYASDGNTLFSGRPRALVLPGDGEEVARVMAVAARHNLPVVPRGAGTGLSGGATPSEGSLVVGLSRLRRIVELDVPGRRARVEPGVVNLDLDAAAARHGLAFVPDPSSQSACTVGGNVAENSGGAHCLRYGVTSHHVLGLELVRMGGERLWLGGPWRDVPGLDLRGLVVGSEGTLGVVTQVWVRLVPRPPASQTLLALFDEEAAAAEAVSRVVARGVLPAALEMMDRVAIRAVERGAHPVGYPADLAAVLLVEVDGTPGDVAEEAAEVLEVIRGLGPREVRQARDPAERALWWANRKTAFGSMGQIAPAYYVQDGVIPRSRLPEVLAQVRRIASEAGLEVANVFHAGDGNLHPLLAYDPAEPGIARRVVEAGSAILQACVAAGGSISGEHGIGLEKRAEMHLMYGPADLELMRRVARAVEPSGRMNPGKLLPDPS